MTRAGAAGIAVAFAALACACGSSGSGAGPGGGVDSGLDAPADVRAEASLDAGQDAAGCTVIQLQSDPHNCGVCGHDCRGAACADGRCAPSDVSVGVEGTEFVSCFTIDDTSIYYSFKTNTGTEQVNKIPKDGGTPTTLADGESGCPLLVTGGSLFWLRDPTTLRKVPIAGGPPSTAVSLTAGGINARRIATDGTNIYWVWQEDVGTGFTQTLNHVATVPLAGGPQTTLADGEPNAGLDKSVATVDGQSVYFFDGMNLKKIPKSGGTPVLLATGNGSDYSVAIAVDSTSVYWLQARFSLFKVPLAGGVPDQIAPAGIADDMVIDKTSAWYCDTDGLKTAALAGGQFHLLLSRTNPSVCNAGLEVDDSWVYFADGDALIHRLPK